MPAQPVVVESEPTGAPPVAVSAANARPVPLSPPVAAPRLALWRSALVLWRSRPLLGIGPDNFRRRYVEVIGPAADGRAYTDTRIHANDLYLETLADLGLVGVAVLAWLALALLRGLRRLSTSGRVVGLGCGLAAGAFFVHGAVDYFLEFTPLFGLFWMLLGLTAAYAENLPPAAPPSSTR
jgi:O-antigen ligase